MTLVTDVPASALAVYAHPDDPEISAGGTLARWAAAGCEVWVLITTRGEKGTSDPDADLDALAELRVEETGKAAELLGFAGHLHLGIGDGELVDDAELRGAIVRHVRELRPEVVLVPGPDRGVLRVELLQPSRPPVTGWATLDAVAPAAGNPHYFPEHRGEGLDGAPGARRLPLGHVGAELLGRHRRDARAQDRRAVLPRQPARRHGDSLGEDWFRAFLRTSAEEAGRAAGVRYAEAFRKIDLG